MFRTGVARWTMTYFGAAFVSFAVAQALIALGLAYPSAPLFAPWTFVAVHLITIGWLTVLILGALRQFVPVITATQPEGDAVAGWALVAIDIGLLAMVAGFVALGGNVPWAASPWLPLGGALVIAGVVADTVIIARPIWRTRPLPLPARFVAAALAFLWVTVLLGLCLALAVARPGTLPPDRVARLLVDGLPLHLLAGIGGWFTLTAMGVGYKLLAMFTLAPEHRGALGDWSFRFSAGGLALAAVAGCVTIAAPAGGAAGPAVLVLERAGWLAAAVGVALYLVDMRKLYAERRRRELELNGRFAAWALVALGAGLALLVAAALAGQGTGWAGPLGYVFLFGWLSGLSLSQLYKIVPFLTWLERFGSKLGKGPVPRVQDLVDEPRARPWFVLYFAAVGVGAATGFAGLDGAWRACSVLSLAASLAIGRELWRIRHSPPPPAAPSVPRG